MKPWSGWAITYMPYNFNNPTVGRNPTFVSILGLDRARSQARMLGDQANRHLEQFGPKADPLRWMTEFVLSRKS